MAVAEIIGAAIGVMLLVIVAYMLVGSVLNTAEVVTTAQKDVTILNEARLRTIINLNVPTPCILIDPPTIPTKYNCTINLSNDGNEIIADFKHMDVFTGSDVATEGFQHSTYSTSCGTTDNYWCIVPINPDTIHPNQLDPGETISIQVRVPGNQPKSFQVTTSNGVNALRTYP